MKAACFIVLIAPVLLAGEDLRAYLDGEIAGERVPSAVVLVDKGGKLVFSYAGGYADRENGRKLTGDELFMIASTTKPFAATAIMTMVDAGKLSLDDRVSKYFPEFRESSTLRQLLSHTSGMAGNDAGRDQLNAIRDFRRPLKDSVQMILRLPLAYEPGERYAYGGASFCVAGRIVEMLSGLEFDEFMRRMVLEPLGMRNTLYRSGPDIAKRVPLVYSRSTGSLRRIKAVMEPPDRPGPRPDGLVLVPGGIYSTAQDSLTLLRLHRADGSLNGKRILAERSAREMRRKQTGNLTTLYGLGWQLRRLDSERYAMEYGHGGAYGTEIWIDRERDLAAVVFTQMPMAEARGFLAEVRKRIRAAF